MAWPSSKSLTAALALVLLAGLAAPRPAAAQRGLVGPPPKNGFAGRYVYKPVPVPPKWDPACVTRWSLSADGTYRLEAGPRVDDGKWAVTYDKTGQSWLTLTEQRSNGLRSRYGSDQGSQDQFLSERRRRADPDLRLTAAGRPAAV
jgi:hypothetical protein